MAQKKYLDLNGLQHFYSKIESNFIPMSGSGDRPIYNSKEIALLEDVGVSLPIEVDGSVSDILKLNVSGETANLISMPELGVLKVGDNNIVTYFEGQWQRSDGSLIFLSTGTIMANDYTLYNLKDKPAATENLRIIDYRPPSSSSQYQIISHTYDSTWGMGLEFGNTDEWLNFKGAGSRPKYNGNEVALLSDVGVSLPIDVNKGQSIITIEETPILQVYKSGMLSIGNDSTQVAVNNLLTVNNLISYQNITVGTDADVTEECPYVLFDMVNGYDVWSTGNEIIKYYDTYPKTEKTLIQLNSNGEWEFGNSERAIQLTGSGTRPTYNGKELALYNDVDDIVTNVYDGIPLVGDYDYYLQINKTSGGMASSATIYFYTDNGITITKEAFGANSNVTISQESTEWEAIADGIIGKKVGCVVTITFNGYSISSQSGVWNQIDAVLPYEFYPSADIFGTASLIETGLMGGISIDRDGNMYANGEGTLFGSITYVV